MVANTIDILLATYNGENFLSELIESLFDQTYQNWRLIIRDDNSNDQTALIIEQYKTKFPAKIHWIRDNDGRLGVIGNFSRLLEHSNAEYSMLCDQDDVWLPEKIDLTFKKINEMESLFSKDTPLLVHSDLKIADHSLNVISESFWDFQKYDPEKGKVIPRTFIQNVAMGCTMMINKPLRELVLPFPEDCVIHDWWLALSASVLGFIDYVNKPTILYRQHKQNYSGARNWRKHSITKNIFRMKEIRNTLLKSQKQVGILLDRHPDKIREELRLLLDTYSQLSSYGFFKRRGVILKNKHFKNGILRNIGVFLLI